MVDVLKEGKARCGLAASIFHFGEHTVHEAKGVFAEQGYSGAQIELSYPIKKYLPRTALSA